ncbi:MAG: hypothetical protein CMP65_04520 [Flavobacteriales bacterium]|nr:hypothetical protein [Flavobacteriales bacterium]
MILSKMNKIYPFLFLILLTSCYEEPFYDLTITVENSELEPISDALVSVQVVDIDSGHVIVEEILEQFYEGVTNYNGEVLFSFENRALVTARTCYNVDGANFCAEGHVYLEENSNTKVRLMLQSQEIENNNCIFCDFLN